MTESNNSYSANDIEQLEGLEAVRLRPGMYIGGVDSSALHHLVARKRWSSKYFRGTEVC